MDWIERVMENMLTFIQGTQPIGQANPRTPDIMDKFQQLNSSIFRDKARANPSESEYCLEQVEKIFDFIDGDEGKKLNCATFMLRDEVDHWWRTVQRTLQDPME